jgi:hypothetical protein
LGEKVKLIVIAVVIVAIAAGALLVLSDSTAVGIDPPVKTVGVATPVKVALTNPHGVRRISAYLEQNGSRYQVFEKKNPAHWFAWSRREAPQTITFEAGKNKAPNLKEGKADLIVEAVSNDFRASKTTTPLEVNVILSAPRVTPDDLQHYINQAAHIPQLSASRQRPQPSLLHVRVRLGPAARCHSAGLRSQCRGDRSHRPFLVQAVPQEIP